MRELVRQASEDGSETDGHKRGDVSQKEAQKRRLQQIATACSTLHNLLQVGATATRDDSWLETPRCVCVLIGLCFHEIFRRVALT
jgi:hypothetical protein